MVLVGMKLLSERDENNGFNTKYLESNTTQ